MKSFKLVAAAVTLVAVSACTSEPEAASAMESPASAVQQAPTARTTGIESKAETEARAMQGVANARSEVDANVERMKQLTAAMEAEKNRGPSSPEEAAIWAEADAAAAAANEAAMKAAREAETGASTTQSVDAAAPVQSADAANGQ